ncbi:MAG TPA: pantetheine-phosphate adenylyltransferase [Coprothermobacter proteolyticus]|uniref:Phosphopantetheine adenylyltransferase n=1 Tax=Coprothermobacter proteolyticus (strain ATCC 35245 / DSM 5265 / OCM 4 / BT) TaxID=309798 RepID=COAD_COPPD|nr:pantetheine-phosphate adenylyltransferase [Coprothermobacter proteolyticus]B5Y7V9.1 RecName: Full=Phosphopantetheine adenylyltransferase; AltName: Full=Dephospho-CoA pyrophosphorylase; AltName: Full=Pantetheine-phosphate adenylyltransferase; Short=PPAT [Coprothermobacter proteolyticus DSM 5265]MBK6586170.1 pantetheine-phosphate adenylyltransferase [Coprothermobacter sp.]ACI16893.1 phosphopantetheine adenylyltransferase [Coprothermobacter proteolyticus DSM 5265]MBP8983715.1 pantetheine-phosph
MTKVVYPGTFDPITKGHLDILVRAAQVFDQVTLLVLSNLQKKSLFSLEERVRLAKSAIEESNAPSNIIVDSYEGVTVHYLEEHGIRLIIRGLRAVSDYEYEIQLFLANKYLNSQVETVLMPTSLRYQFVSSSLVKEMVSFGLDVSEFVTPTVERALKEKLEVKQ